MNVIDNIKIESYILREVGALARTIHSVVEINFKELGLQKGQFIYLIRIHEHPGINLIQLSTMLKVDKTTTTKVVQKLIEKEFITKERDTDDKRSYKLYPTSKSLDIYKKIIAEENKSIETCFRGFSETQKDMVYELVKKMRENIESSWYEVKNYKE